MYRVGFPFWRQASRLGVPVNFVVVVQRDDEAGVYYASSPNLKGLHVEGETLDELREEIRGAAFELMKRELHGKPEHANPVYRFRDAAICA